MTVHRTYSQRKWEETVGPIPELTKARKSEAAKKAWARRREAAREHKLAELEQLLEAK